MLAKGIALDREGQFTRVEPQFADAPDKDGKDEEEPPCEFDLHSVQKLLHILPFVCGPLQTFRYRTTSILQDVEAKCVVNGQRLRHEKLKRGDVIVAFLLIGARIKIPMIDEHTCADFQIMNIKWLKGSTKTEQDKAIALSAAFRQLPTTAPNPKPPEDDTPPPAVAAESK